LTVPSMARQLSSKPISWGPIPCSMARALIGAACRKCAKTVSASITSPPTRCTAPLGETGFFTEETAYAPNSPYSASKASSDHLVRAWNHTYGMPVVTTNCSNNYGPYHFPEKLIPLMILNALEGKPLPIYGKGDNVRDWLYVDDHASALRLVLDQGKPGETYNIGGHNERTNLQVVNGICALLDELAPRGEGSYATQLTYVKDRPGHDKRYAIDAGKIERELGWKPQETFESGLRKTVQWYLDNRDWCEQVQSDKYRRERLGALN